MTTDHKHVQVAALDLVACFLLQKGQGSHGPWTEKIRADLRAGYVKPSPVQARAIPLGKFGADLIVQAKSGTGKTCMFSVIVLESLQLALPAEQALIVSPTRELAHQVPGVQVGFRVQTVTLNPKP
jgi:superfamily II DNA/RNA helicase